MYVAKTVQMPALSPTSSGMLGGPGEGWRCGYALHGIRLSGSLHCQHDHTHCCGPVLAGIFMIITYNAVILIMLRVWPSFHSSTAVWV